MNYDFDQPIDRHHTNCVKLEKMTLLFGRNDLIPLWVADMDFLSPLAITNALQKRVEHGLFGYTLAPDDYYNAIIGWLHRKYRWKVDKEHISFVPGVVKGIAFALEAFTKVGDKVIIQPPVYQHFKQTAEALNRTIVNNPLMFENDQYRMDFDGLRNILANQECKMLLLCNPHNPGGRVWDANELRTLADICHKHNVLVVSDEIHADLTFPPFQHTPFSTVSAEAEATSMTLMAPSKTFNIAGIVSSFAVIQNETIRETYFRYLETRELNQAPLFALTATQAAYTECNDWLNQLLNYLQGNIDFVISYLSTNLPQIKAIEPQASFLVWLDCRELNLSQDALVDLFVNKARLALMDGKVYGSNGEGFMRMNIAVPRAILEKALSQLNCVLH